jgi:hypothetical protein
MTLMAKCLTGREDAACIAGRVLLAWRSGTSVDYDKQLERSRNVMPQSSALDTCEMEKLEALQGALECLKTLPHARVSAAIRLLEHLAKREVTKVKR